MPEMSSGMNGLKRHRRRESAVTIQEVMGDGKRELRNTRKARKGKPSYCFKDDGYKQSITFAYFGHFVVKSDFR
jgi:hypothetical protein